MKTELNREQLITYIRKNSFCYSGAALFYCFSNEQLLQLKKRIKMQKKQTDEKEKSIRQ